MTENSPFLPGLSPVAGKELCARFDGGRLSSDGGVLLLRERRVVARVEATSKGADIRFIVTNLPGRAKLLYEKIYCARGRMENMIKDHKLYTKSDRTSCHRWEANQFRLFTTIPGKGRYVECLMMAAQDKSVSLVEPFRLSFP